MIVVYGIVLVIGLFILHAIISNGVKTGILDALDAIQRQRDKQDETEDESPPPHTQIPAVIPVEDTVFAEMEDLLSDLERNAPKVRKK